MSDPTIIPTPIKRYLGNYIARRRRIALLRSVGVACVFAILWTLLWSFVDRLSPLPVLMRLILLILNALICIAILIPSLRAILHRRFDWITAAAQVERRDSRFAGRLETAVSQLFLPPSIRGSPAMVAALVGEVDRISAQPCLRPLVPLAPTLRPWWGVITLILFGVILCASAWLDLPTLIRRQIRPLVLIAPITTTRITIDPGSMNVAQGESVTIVARAVRLGDSPVNIRLTSDGRNFSTQQMTQAGDGRFTFALNDIDRDWQYQITGGDAHSAIYSLNVLRRPGVAQFRVQYVYPAPLNRSPRTSISTDGLLEAPAGTQATLDLICTEPVASAVIIVNGPRIVARATAESNVYRATIPIVQSTSYQVELRSDRGVPGIAPPDTVIRVLTDQPSSPTTIASLVPAPHPQIAPTSQPDAPAVEATPGYDEPLRLYFQLLNGTR